MSRRFLASLAIALMIVTAARSYSADAPAAAKGNSQTPSAESLERARKIVKMLDEIYKNAIVLITDKYVNSEEDFPAGSAAVALFANVSKGGSHEVRLIDVTGKPYDDKNVAQDNFEKEGVKRLKAGATSFEEVVQKGDHHQLRSMTAVPVVMKKCVMCHAHYADAKPGEAIGAISYTIPID